MEAALKQVVLRKAASKKAALRKDAVRKAASRKAASMKAASTGCLVEARLPPGGCFEASCPDEGGLEEGCFA